ncbi:MAG: pantoate--beta-alanine ligase [Balneola sp.]|jgi:pantoate--beta-alanine ligase|nr:pantoate--beta-alanine ligase [Balneola sp.]MBE78052.1 pantoate--beta-alanine ligase [Balneola sp.]HBX66761.1 pantoate--beta-alanine ligase [Balneolaceae bacterium]|tara:strand:+ start:34574 stop:35425 length:852 start_codon:yes stop_codon:yes gene_type:complete
MKQIASINEIREAVAGLRADGKTIAFVPTMGALHEGHLSLIRLAKENADEVVVSIYVNPEQFGPNEDFESYPRQMEEDLKACEKEGVAAVFTPNDEIMYGSDKKYLSIKIDTLNEHMDGVSRPGFFEGIVLVVNKLFNIIKPDFAVFGQKDIQQFQILSQMVEEFNHNIKLIAGPIARANDGLALSSRNAYLSDQERKIAPSLYRALQYVEKQIRDGVDEPSLLLKHQQDELEAKGFKNDYLNVFSQKEMHPVEKLEPGKTYILAGAVYLGKTRLIDNIILDL